jgi:hypothetical protein
MRSVSRPDQSHAVAKEMGTPVMCSVKQLSKGELEDVHSGLQEREAEGEEAVRRSKDREPNR